MNSIFNKIPDVSFIENRSLEEERDELIRDYQIKYMELTGIENYTLPRASPYRLILEAIALRTYQGALWLDKMGKMNLLKYAFGEYLDSLGVSFGIVRKKGEPAKTTIRFTLSAPRPSAVTIPAGTRCTNGNVYFKTAKVAEIQQGQTHTDIECVCSEAGKIGNGLSAGEINTLVDSVAYIASVKNLSTTAYGTDIESDEDMRDRIYQASSSFSVAGPEGAYIYFAKEYSSLITDVKVTNPKPREVDIRVVLKGGKLPDSEFCNGLKAYLSVDDKRPLTDVVSVAAPQQATYSINATYYINSSDKANAAAIQEAVKEAVKAYTEWQDTKIGRDINPSQLIRLMLNAGAKRVDITSPMFQSVPATALAHVAGSTVNYGGLEDD